MSFGSLVKSLGLRGICIAADGNELICSPMSEVDDKLLVSLKTHKQGLLMMLHSVSETKQKCGDCQRLLVLQATFDSFFNIVCPACNQCFGCRPGTADVAAKFNTANPACLNTTMVGN